jgi:hypothetical protein
LPSPRLRPFPTAVKHTSISAAVIRIIQILYEFEKYPHQYYPHVSKYSLKFLQVDLGDRIPSQIVFGSINSL